MKKTALFLLCAGIMCACNPSDSENNFSPAQQRKEKVSRYLKAARSLDAQNKERALPLTAAGVSAPSVSISEEELRALPAEMLLRKQVLEDWLRDSYGEEAAARAGELILRYHREAMRALKTAKTPEEMAELLNKIEMRHSRRLETFVKQEQEKIWVRPNAVQLNQARLEMEKNAEALLTEVERVYGAECAEKVKPLLQNLPQEGVKAMGAANSREELNAALSQLFAAADQQIKAVIVEHGDPEYSLPKEEINQMRAEMNKDYQPLEQKVSRLYGRRAVLQLRALFNQFVDGATQVAQEKSRASEKSAKIEALNKTYQRKVAGLQEELNRRLATQKAQKTQKTQTIKKESSAQKKRSSGAAKTSKTKK